MSERELSERLADAAREPEDDDAEWVRHQVSPKSPSAVYSVRIPVDRIEELRRLAAERGLPPTALIRTWVLAQLDAASGTDEQAKRWEQDFRATTERLRELLDERPWAS